MMLRKFICLITLFLLLFTVTSCAADTGSLDADNISYNVNTKIVQAIGNVVIKRESATIWGERAEGNTETSDFTVKGNVKGNFPEHKAKISSNSIRWHKDLNKKVDIVEAFGAVNLTQEPKDKISADYIKWEFETKNYVARGRVDGILGNKIIKANEIGRSEAKFWGRKVIRYEDVDQKIGFSGNRLDGTIKNEEIQSAVAVGSVSIDFVDNEGLKSVITGERSIYSKANATLIVMGKAHMVRSDGKTADADKFILHEDTKNIEAIGNSRMIFNISDKSNKDNQEKKKRDK